MIARIFTAALLAAVATPLPAQSAPAQAVAAQPAPVAEAAEPRPLGADILFWSQAQRDANFPAMEKLFPGTVAPASARPRPLPAGAPLDLPAAEAYLAATNLAGILVLQDGKIRYERYARGHGPAGRYTSFSVAKSLTSTLVGAAVKDGHIASLDDPVTRYIPELTGSAYDGVSVRQVLTMTSGVKWNEDYTDPRSDVARMYGTPVPAGMDPTVAYLRTLSREAPPGGKWLYKTGETNLIGVLVSKATGKSLTDYAAEKIWGPYGMERPLFWMVDQSGQNVGGCCLSASLRDYGRIGQFVLEGGAGVVPDGWFADATRAWSPVPGGRGYGYQWWTNGDGSFQAQGIFGQLIHIDPARRLVVVTSGAWPKATGAELSQARAAFIQAVHHAIDGAD